MQKTYFIIISIICFGFSFAILGLLGPLIVNPLVVIIFVEKGNKINAEKKDIKYFIKKFYWVNFKFKGRINRYEFLFYGGPMFFGVLTLVLIPIIIFESFISLDSLEVFFAVPLGVVFIFHQFAVYIKRLHDLNKSGWHLLWQLLPILGHIYILILCFFTKGTNGLNNYGPDPNNYYGIDPNYKEKEKPPSYKFSFNKNKIERRLEELQQLLDKNIISKEEYEIQRKKIIGET